MEGINLDAVLGDEGDVQPVETPEVNEPQETEAQAAERLRDEKGRFAPKGENQGSTPEPVENEIPEDQFKGYLTEKKKRQEWEAKYGALNSEVETLKQQLQALQAPKEPEAPPPTIWDDEQGWQQHFGGQVVNTAVQQATLNARLDMSEMLARQANPDFEEMKATFIELMQENPSLQKQAMEDPHPWNKAYQIAKNHKAMQELAAVDLTDLEAKIEARLREKLAAETPQQQQPQANLPTSLADAQSSRAVNAAPGPISLEQILGR